MIREFVRKEIVAEARFITANDIDITIWGVVCGIRMRFPKWRSRVKKYQRSLFD